MCLFVFDILYLNGISFLNKTLQERRDILFSTLHEVPGKIEFVKFENCNNFEEIELVLAESIKIGCEGLMLKTLTT